MAYANNSREQRDRIASKVLDHLEVLIDSEIMLKGSGQFEARMLRAARVLQCIETEGPELVQRLKAMNHFATFCVSNLTEEEIQPVRVAISRYLDKLKDETG